MSELMRFQVARAVQRRSGPLPALSIGGSERVRGWLEGDGAVGNAAVFLTDRGLAPPVRRYLAPPAAQPQADQIRALDHYLAECSNRPQAAELERFIRGQLDSDVNSLLLRWSALEEDLDAVLVAVVLADATVDLRSDVMRLVVIIGALRLLAGTSDLDPDELRARLAERERGPHSWDPLVEHALRWRDVALPEGLLEVRGGPHSLVVRPPGVADLWVVRDEWARYESGSIAHIENVLAGESKVRSLERLTEQETTVTVEEDRATVIEQDSATTSRFELAREAQKDTELSAHVEGQVDTSGQYGPTNVAVHVGGSLDYSVADSDRLAVTQANETVQRAVTRLEERVQRQRITRSLSRVEENDSHTLDNSGNKEQHVIGIYRWVDKIMRVQMFRYPHRMLFEFEIPEPASFVRWLAKRPVSDVSAPDPGFFTINGLEGGKSLTPEAIGLPGQGQGTVPYQDLGSRFFATGLPAPPSSEVVFATFAPPGPVPKYSIGTAAIPKGTEAHKFAVHAVATSGVQQGPNQPLWKAWFEVVVGTDFPSTTQTDDDPASIWRFQGTGAFRDLKWMNFRTPLTGTVPIQLATAGTDGLLATVELHCRPTESAVREWRQKVYDQLSAAYWEMKHRYDDEVSQRSTRTGLTVEGESEARNRQRVTDELRKFVVEMLVGKRFLGRSATGQVDLDPTKAIQLAPSVEMAKAHSDAAEIQFLEQAFEWENLTYVLYPYFWAGSQRWAELSEVRSPDPMFDEFLRCGSARVVLPARPGFEGQATLYTLFGALWGGGPVPGPGDDLYMSAAEEIREQQRRVADGEPGKTWEVRLPTTLLYLEPTGTTLPLKNDAALLPRPSDPQ